MPLTDSKTRRFIIVCLLALAILAVFWPVLGARFVAWDDDINVYEDPLLNPPSLANVATIWKAPYLRLYIPLTYTLWSGLAALSPRASGPGSPLSPRLFHAANLLCHLLAGLVAFALLRKLLETLLPPPPRPAKKNQPEDARRPAALDWAAGAGAALFALHPVQVEVAAWVSGFRDVLSGLCALLALQQYVAFAASPRGQKAMLSYAFGTAAFLAAMLAKPSAVVIPVLALILDHGILRRSARSLAAPLAGWFLLALACAAATQGSQGATHIRAMVPLWDRPLIAADSLAFYLYKLLLPLHLSPDYGRPPDLVLAKGWLYYTWLAPASLAAVIALNRERRLLWCCAGLFAAGALPVLGLVPFLHQDLSTVADRYLYLSMLGPALAGAWWLARADARWAWGAGTLALLVFGARSAAQARTWNNTGTLFEHIVALNPDSGIAHLNLGNFLAEQGKTAEAKFHFSQTLRLRPGDGLADNHLGSLLLEEGKTAEAMAYFNDAISHGVPDSVVSAHNNLGIAMMRLGRLEEAAREYSAALRLDPRREKLHGNLAGVLERQGKLQEALAHYQLALELKSDDADMRKRLAVLLARSGRLDEARAQYAQAAGVAPDSVESYAALCDSLQVANLFDKAVPCYQELVRKAPAIAEAYNSLGYALSKQGRMGEALEQYRRSVRLKPGYLAAEFNLGSALLSQGKADEVIALWKKALDAAPSSVELRHNLGLVLMRQGRKDEARQQFETALILRPDFEPSRQALAALR